MQSMCVEHLDRLGIVAGFSRQIGLAEYLDALAGPRQQRWPNCISLNCTRSSCPVDVRKSL
jgi:hypothetical protein